MTTRRRLPGRNISAACPRGHRRRGQTRSSPSHCPAVRSASNIATRVSISCGDLLERRVRRLVAGAFGGGIGDTPVSGDRRSWKLRTDLAHLVAQRDDTVESVAGEASERLRRPTGNVDTALRHDPHRVRVQWLGVAARAACLDGARRRVLEQGLGDLGTGAVASTQEQNPSAGPSRRDLAGGRRCEREPGMQRAPGFAEEVPAVKEIGPVVDVATVGGASAGADDAATSKLGQVVRHKVRRLPDELHELSDTAIAASELAEQLPSQRIAEQTEDRGWLRRLHHDAITSVWIDSMQVDRSAACHHLEAGKFRFRSATTSPRTRRSRQTDMVGSTAVASGVDPDTADEWRRRHFVLLRHAVAEVAGSR